MQEIKFVPMANLRKKPLPAWATGTVSTSMGTVIRISTHLSRADLWGTVKSRASAFRMHYTVPPGLYAVGEPNQTSGVFVSANYKMSFDLLRRGLAGMNAWVLVLDTKGINVWCAAGKGTFGTDELVKRIAEAKLDTIVTHRRIILPQLGAVGVSAGGVRKKTGFRVSFGPVDARDIPAYVSAGYKKTPEMSATKFTMFDRVVLTPMEINPVMRKYPWFAAAVLLVFGLQPSGILFAQAWYGGLPFLILGLLAVFSGAFLTPILLPFVPFRSFAIKGWILGLVSALGATHVLFYYFNMQNPILVAIAFILFPALSSYIALQFTGSTTFTGMSGVKKELKIGIPLYIVAAGISLLLLVWFKIQEMSKAL
jgi:CO dehydrogenase/acetyl-CoA synthase delta subunit